MSVHHNEITGTEKVIIRSPKKNEGKILLFITSIPSKTVILNIFVILANVIFFYHVCHILTSFASFRKHEQIY